MQRYNIFSLHYKEQSSISNRANDFCFWPGTVHLRVWTFLRCSLLVKVHKSVGIGRGEARAMINLLNHYRASTLYIGLATGG